MKAYFGQAERQVIILNILLMTDKNFLKRKSLFRSPDMNVRMSHGEKLNPGARIFGETKKFPFFFSLSFLSGFFCSPSK